MEFYCKVKRKKLSVKKVGVLKKCVYKNNLIKNALIFYKKNIRKKNRVVALSIIFFQIFKKMRVFMRIIYNYLKTTLKKPQKNANFSRIFA